jgi:glutaredoxin-like protein NrdH
MHKSVKIYTLSTCSHCKAAKKLLNDHNVSYDCTDVDLLDTMNRVAILEEVKRYNPKCTFPTIIIGEGTVIIGFREKEIKEALDL